MNETATFRFKQSVDDIEDPVLMPVDWYEFEIVEVPSIQPNATLRDAMKEAGSELNPRIPPSDEQLKLMDSFIATDEKCGRNLVIRLRSEADDPEYSGRKFTLWLQWPHEADEDRWNDRGQKLYDAKQSRVVEFTEAFGGSVDGEEISLSKGLKGSLYVTQQRAQNSEELVNTIDVFAGFKEYGEE